MVYNINNHYQNTIIRDNPVIYYPFNELTGTTANNIMSNNYDGTYTNDYTLGSSGLISNSSHTSVYFKGNNDYTLVSTYKLGAALLPYTWEFWFKVDAGEILNGGYLISQNIILGGLSLFYKSLTGKLSYYNTGFSGADPILVRTSYALSDNVTYYITITKNASGIVRFYINGQRELNLEDGASNPITEILDDKGFLNVTMNLGSKSGTTENSLLGNLDEFALYEYALTPEQILSHYNAASDTLFSTGETATFGASKIKLVNSNYPNSSLSYAGNPSTLTVSYFAPNTVSDLQEPKFDHVTLGGVPLSISGYSYNDNSYDDNDIHHLHHSPSYHDVKVFYALDIIEIIIPDNSNHNFNYFR